MGIFSKKKKPEIKKTSIPDNILQDTFDKLIDDFVDGKMTGGEVKDIIQKLLQE